MSTARLLMLALLLHSSCATGEVAEPALTKSSEVTQVQVFGDGFLTLGSRRMPLETFILEMRQRIHALAAEERAAVQVDIAVDPNSGKAGADGADFLLQQLQIIGIKQFRVR